MEKIIFHIDVNSAYLSWSAADKLKNGEKLDIRLVPSVIGGDENSRRGVVLAKSDKAKHFGIITGESLYSARKKCNNLIVIPPNFKIYEESSKNMFEFLQNYTPYIQKYSIDECFLDMGINKRQDALKLAEMIRKEIKEKFNFTVSIGVATNKLLAKMASELKKPDKVNTIFKEEIEMKLWHLPVEELFMVGKSAKRILNLMYIYTIGELANSDKDLIKDRLKGMGELIWNYANGIDFSKVEYDKEDIKNISNEITLSTDLLRREKAHNVILELADKVSYRLRKNKKYCYSISVNIKTNEFKSYSHQRKMLNSTNSTKVICKVAIELFNRCWKGEPIRLLGISLSNLTDTYTEQLSLISLKDGNEKGSKSNVDSILDHMREKYGKI
ncbi:DNA-damage repair protein, dinP/uvrX ortholog [Clostridium putrefaciens]|uniref:DNA polymerase IV n=1 Tax=Clostridium putrefaciens TaxID=99675 RepID=A0A381J6S9_9CLOT|nr:DNA polymerase IV [Clostridium putrefaciens]SUY46699.1 DNA-damage repair protein, dinP/uvrX ortholog [Clostridium putrefaciens]